jgi:hypothetical protein
LRGGLPIAALSRPQFELTGNCAAGSLSGPCHCCMDIRIQFLDYHPRAALDIH